MQWWWQFPEPRTKQRLMKKKLHQPSYDSGRYCSEIFSCEKNLRLYEMPWNWILWYVSYCTWTCDKHYFDPNLLYLEFLETRHRIVLLGSHSVSVCCCKCPFAGFFWAIYDLCLICCGAAPLDHLVAVPMHTSTLLSGKINIIHSFLIYTNAHAHTRTHIHTHR